MLIDAGIDSDPFKAPLAAQNLESLGYDGIRVAETNRDPFIALSLVANATTTIELVTSVVVAFARNPLSLALQAHELNRLANGRLVLGIGSQVKPHIERRYSMPWHKPAKQMREFLQAMHAIFDCWYQGVRLEFEGEYYQHTLMPSTFTPPDREQSFQPKILLSATGPLMTKVAAEEADGLITHPFSTSEYLQDITLPALQEGLNNRQRTRDDFQLDHAPMLAIGDTDEELSRAIGVVKDRIAFYGCTRAYRPVLDHHGWGELQDELIPLNRAHQRQDMINLITDEILHTIAIVGSPEEVISKMKTRFSGVVDRTSLNISHLPVERQRELINQFKGSLH